MNQHYFMFSEGEYSDYMVGGLYVCDHEVTEKEWNDHCKQYDQERESKQIEIYGSPNEHWESRDKKKHDAFGKWRRENEPDKTFIKKHNMTEIEYTEMWQS